MSQMNPNYTIFQGRPVPKEFAEAQLAQYAADADREYASHLKNGGAPLPQELMQVFRQSSPDVRTGMLRGTTPEEEPSRFMQNAADAFRYFNSHYLDDEGNVVEREVTPEEIAAQAAEQARLQEAQRKIDANSRSKLTGGDILYPDTGKFNNTSKAEGVLRYVPESSQYGEVAETMQRTGTSADNIPIGEAVTPLGNVAGNTYGAVFENTGPIGMAAEFAIPIGKGVTALGNTLRRGYNFAKANAKPLAAATAASGAAIAAPMVAEGGNGISVTDENKELILQELSRRNIDISTPEGEQQFRNMLKNTSPEMLAEGKWGSSDRTWTDKAINTVGNVIDWAVDDPVKAGAAVAGLGAAAAFRKPIFNAAKGVISSTAKGTAKAINKPLALGTTSENLLKIGDAGGAIAADGKAQLVDRLAPTSTDFAAQNIKKAAHEAEAFQSNYGINLTGQDKEFSKASLAFDTLARAKAEQAGTFGGASDTLSRIDKAMDSATNGADHAILKSASDDISAHIKQAEHIANGGKGENTSLSTKTLFREPVKNADGTTKLGTDGKPIYAQNEEKLNRFAQLLGYQDAADPAFADAIKSVRFTDASHAQANFESAMKTLANNINQLEIHEASTARKGLTKYFNDLRARAKQLYGIDIDPEIGALTAKNAGGKAYDNTFKNAYHFRARNQYRKELGEANMYTPPRASQTTSTITSKAESIAKKAEGIRSQRLKTVTDDANLQTTFSELQKAVEAQTKAAEKINTAAADMTESEMDSLTKMLDIEPQLKTAKDAVTNFIKQHPEYTEEEVFKILKAKTGMTQEELAALGGKAEAAKTSAKLKNDTIDTFKRIQETTDSAEQSKILNDFAEQHNLNAKQLQKDYVKWSGENGKADFGKEEAKKLKRAEIESAKTRIFSKKSYSESEINSMLDEISENPNLTIDEKHELVSALRDHVKNLPPAPEEELRPILQLDNNALIMYGKPIGELTSEQLANVQSTIVYNGRPFYRTGSSNGRIHGKKQ